MPKQTREHTYSPRRTTPEISTLLLLPFLLFGRIEAVSAQSPSVLTPPGDQLVRRGDNVTLTASAAGTPPLSFQWNFNGGDLSWATNSTLVLTNVSPTQEGRYAVRVANSLGSITSADAKVTVCWDVVLSSVEKTNAAPALRGGKLLGYDNTGNLYTIRELPGTSTPSQWNGFILDKLSADHEKLWEARYSDANSDTSFFPSFNRFNVDNPGNIWVTGVTHTTGAPDLLTVIRFDAHGQIAGITKGAFSAVNFAVNDRGEVFAVPEWDTTSIRNEDLEIVKYDPSGVEVWRDTVVSTTFPESVTGAVAVAGSDGSVLAVATLRVGAFGKTGLVLAKYDMTGSRLWLSQQDYQSDGEMSPKVDVVSDGSIYVTTATRDVSAIFNQARKFSSTGELLWENFQISVGPDLSSRVDAAGNLYWVNLAMAHDHLGPPYDYFATVWKYDPEGNLAWSRSGNIETEPDDSSALGIDAAGNIALDLFHGKVPSFTTFHFEQNPVPGWPVIASFPGYALPIYAGAALSMKLDARGASPLHFQWRLNGADILGATNAELRISNAQANNTGNYTLLVTNLVGCTLSPPIYRQVIGSPMSRFDQPRILREVVPLDNGSSITNTYFDVTIYTAAGWNYSVQTSPNFRNWEDSEPINVSDSTETPMRFRLEDGRFFRVVWRSW